MQEYQEVRSVYVAKTTLTNDAGVLRMFVNGVGDRQVHTLTSRQVEQWFAGEAKRQNPRSCPAPTGQRDAPPVSGCP